MPIEQVFLSLCAGAACVGIVLWLRRQQRLARSRITIADPALPKERLEELFIRHVANRGRDPHDVRSDHVVCQPQHLAWTMSLRISESHDELGSPLTVGVTRLDHVHLVPFPRQHQLWTVVDRWYELAPRMRALMRAIRADYPNADISLDLEMFKT